MMNLEHGKRIVTENTRLAANRLATFRNGFALCAALAVATASLTAQAGWTYDSSAGTLSDGGYTFKVNLLTGTSGIVDPSSETGAKVDGFQITGLANAGTGETIDFTNAKTEAGYDVISFDGDYVNKILNNTPCKTLIAPALMYLGRMTFRENKVLESLTISEKITTFPYYCFESATALKSISPTRFPYVVDSGTCAFQNATSLAVAFDLPNVTKLGESTFQKTAITSISMPNIKKVDGNVFRSCSMLEGDFNLTELESIGSCAFMGSQKITSFVAPKATAVGTYAFNGCSALTNAVFSTDLDTIENEMFNSCKLLTSFVAKNVRKIGESAFANCSALASIEASQVTNVGSSAFSKCVVLKSVDMPDLEFVGNSAFKGCSVLTSFVAPKVTSVGSYAFSDCSAITKIQLGAACATNYGNEAYASCANLVDLEPWPSFLNITNTGTDSLINPITGCKSLVGSIVLTGPEGLHTIPQAWMNMCQNITSITIRTPWIKTVGRYSVQQLAPGAVIYWNTDKAPTSFGQSFYSNDSNNRTRIIVQNDIAGWSNATYNAGITDNDKARSDYPGKKTFGKIQDAYAYLVKGGVSGMMILIR